MKEALIPDPLTVPADLKTPEARGRLAQMIMRLFEHWQLSTAEQAALLGLSADNRSTLSRYRKGDPLADSRDLLDRAGHLLGVHKSLRIQFPQDRDLEGVPPVRFLYVRDRNERHGHSLLLWCERVLVARYFFSVTAAPDERFAPGLRMTDCPDVRPERISVSRPIDRPATIGVSTAVDPSSRNTTLLPPRWAIAAASTASTGASPAVRADS